MVAFYSIVYAVACMQMFGKEGNPCKIEECLQSGMMIAVLVL